MFHTHLSHLGLSELKQTNTHMFLGSPNLGNCKRALLTHGLELDTIGYRHIGGTIPDHALYDCNAPVLYHYRSKAHTALIARWAPNLWCAMLPLDLWHSER